MNQDKKFQQISEFRREDDNGDTSDESKMMNPSEEKPVLNVVLMCEKIDDTSKGIKAMKPDKKQKSEKTEAKPDKKKTNNVVKSVFMKKVIRNLRIKQSQMFEDLKNFAGSVIDELKVSREKMFAQMKEELMVSRPRETRVMQTKNRTPPPQNGTKWNLMNLHNWSDGLVEKGTKRVVASDVLISTALEVAAKYDHVTQVITNKRRLGRLPLMTFVPNPQAHVTKNGIHFDGAGATTSKDNSDGLLFKQRPYHGVPPFPKVVQSFHKLISKDVGSSMEGGSNILRQTYSDAKFQKQKRVGLTCDGILRNCMTNNVFQRNEGADLAQSRSLVMKDCQVCPCLRNKRFKYDPGSSSGNK